MPDAPAGSEADARAFMRRNVLFADLHEADFERIYSMAEAVTVESGGVLFEEGSRGDALFVVVKGELEVTVREGAREVMLATRGPGEFVGELSLLQDAPRSATVRARTRADLLAIRRPAFRSLIACSPAATLQILGTVAARLQSTEALLKQQEKMASLGTLAAGLAHELNNPAAAIRRSMEHLRQAVSELVDASAALVGIDPAAREALWAARAARSTAAPTPDGLARARAEEQVEAWLEDRKVDRAWELAPVLAGIGLDGAALETLAGALAPADLPAALRWLAAGGEVDSLVREATMSASAISAIVAAVKSYSRVDQAPIQEIDVHETLESTLVILKHKLSQGMQVTREYAPDLPRIEAYASELAQVWTNLVDNAIHATGGRGSLVIRTRAGPGEVTVQIIDDGPGISAEQQSRVFDPFFTTKPFGVGTGLGLHIVRNIVVDRHRGQIDLESRPGHTCFTVRLPVRLPRS